MVLELMELTYGKRRIFVTRKATCVHEIVDKYPALKMPDVVSAFRCLHGEVYVCT